MVKRSVWPRFNAPLVTQEEAEETPIEDADVAQRIVVPDEEEREAILARAHNHGRCGECRNFRLEQGQAELADQKTFKRVFGELAHDPAWYGSTGAFGLCAKWDGHMCHKMAPATIPYHFIDSSVDTTIVTQLGQKLPHPDKDTPVDCPYFKGGHKSVAHFRGKKHTHEELD